MIRYLVVSFATISLLFTNAACTSKKVDSEPDATAEMSEDGSDMMADAEGSEGSSDFNEEDDFGSGESVADAAPEGGDAVASSDGFDEAPADDPFADNSETPAEIPSADDMMTAEASQDDSTSELGTEAPMESSLADSGSSLGSDEMGGLGEEPPAPKPVVPLKKIQTAPWEQGGVLVNAVYVARPGDTFKTVSQKIYGSDEKVSELRKVNPTIAARKMKVGDKIYYNSPKRPTDNMQLLTFYEDVGLSPEVYIAQPGDDLREVSKRLLGDSNSWKEIWATNLDVDSKGELPEGTRLRYWAGDLVAQAPMAPAPEAPAPPQDYAAAPDMPAEAPPMPEEAPMPPSTAEVAPPPSFEPPPPPPPVMAEAPPVPAEVPQMDANADDPLAAILGGEGDQTMALMIGAILLITAVGLFIIIRKRKARRNIEFQTATHTQLD